MRTRCGTSGQTGSDGGLARCARAGGVRRLRAGPRDAGELAARARVRRRRCSAGCVLTAAFRRAPRRQPEAPVSRRRPAVSPSSFPLPLVPLPGLPRSLRPSHMGG